VSGLNQQSWKLPTG